MSEHTSTSPATTTPDAATPSAGEVCAAFLERDAAAAALGIRLVEAGPGRATLSMTVRADMLNGLDTCHGGIIFTLADAAMALASNSHNERAFAVNADIDWLSPVALGSVLTASAVQTVVRGRTAVNDVTVADGTGMIVATFRGRTRTVGGPVLPIDPD